MPDPTITQVGTKVQGALYSDASDADKHLYSVAELLTAQSVPRVYTQYTINVRSTNTGSVARGSGNMAALADGRELDPLQPATEPDVGCGPMHDTAGDFLYFETPGDGIDFRGTTR